MPPGPWRMGIGSWGECLPYHSNRLYLTPGKTDQWGQPVVTFDCEWKENELAMRKDMKASAVEMLEAAGLKDVTPFDDGSSPGLCIHEMGTARMGRDQERSVVNEWGRSHDVKNLFIVDGSVFVTGGGVNPTSTIQAVALYIADQIKQRLANLFD